jgi:hypothetical protein
MMKLVRGGPSRFKRKGGPQERPPDEVRRL